jgi:RND family efflux transporter MFP subunit
MKGLRMRNYPQQWLIGLAAIAAAGVASAAELASITVQKQTVPQERSFDGVIEAVNQSTVSAQTSGRVTEINYDVDDIVPKGAVILRIRDSEQRSRLQQSQAGLSEAEARYKEAEADYKRIKDIYAQRLIAKSDLDRAEAAFHAAKARLEQARGRVGETQEQQGYTVIRAPFSGIVTKRFVELGESVSAGQPLMAGMSLEQLRAIVTVPQAFVKAMRAHGKASVELADGQRLEVASMRIFPYADESSHAVSVRVNLPAGDFGIYPGMFVKVGFVTGEREAIQVPVASVAHRSELTALYVIGDDGRIGFRQVRLGNIQRRVSGDQVEVLAGLESGEKVALDPIAAGIALKQQAR